MLVRPEEKREKEQGARGRGKTKGVSGWIQEGSAEGMGKVKGGSEGVSEGG